jgi:methylase of polypeptide subunit release factors
MARMIPLPEPADAPHPEFLEDLGRVREAFIAADYTADGVAGLLGQVAHAALARQESVPARRAAAGPSPLAVLVRLFLLGDRVEPDEAAAVLPLEPAERLGLVAAVAGGVRARLDARPHDDGFYVVSDLSSGLDGDVRPVPPDHVLGIGGASVSLANLTVRAPVDRALDLGTGCGVQALHLTRHARSVTATDVLSRALALTRLGAGLSDVRLDLRHGSLFEPVAGERFDLIVSNPPFVIGGGSAGGDAHRTYRDGGLPGDELCRRLVQAAPEHLTEGGWCQVLANWVHRRGEDWTERVGEWLPVGCDAWAVQRSVLDPAAYVALWLQDVGDMAGPSYLARYDAWLDAFERADVEAIGFGWITLRRTDAASPLRRVEDWPHAVDSPLGPHVADAFARAAWLRAHPRDDDLLAATLRVAEAVVQEQIGPPGADDPEHVVLRQRGGLRRARTVDTATAGLVGACDGTLPLGTLIDAVAIVLDADTDDLRIRLSGLARELVAEGFLEPVRP